MAEEVPHYPCPKCGNPEAALKYLRSWNVVLCPTTGHDGEHFHRICQRCSFVWATYDVLQEVADG